jgi:hypothetical protein
VVLFEASRLTDWVEKTCHEDVARWLGLAPDAPGFVSWDVFDAVLTPGDVIVSDLLIWPRSPDRGQFAGFESKIRSFSRPGPPYHDNREGRGSEDQRTNVTGLRS